MWCASCAGSTHPILREKYGGNVSPLTTARRDIRHKALDMAGQLSHLRFSSRLGLMREVFNEIPLSSELIYEDFKHKAVVRTDHHGGQWCIKAPSGQVKERAYCVKRSQTGRVVPLGTILHPAFR
jgi:hypothetical protein